MLPDDSQAYQFAVMLHHGLPASEAMCYFLETDDPGELAQATRVWQRSKRVLLAKQKLLGKEWELMSDDEKARAMLSQHYAQLAYFLGSIHYAEANAAEKAKLDTARSTLEAKVAGVAGKGDALQRFFDDLNKGVVKLPPRALPN